jgi:hypothetical protein
VIGIRLLLFTLLPPFSLARGVAVPENVLGEGSLRECARLSPETLEGLCLARAAAAREDDCVGVAAVCRLALYAVTVDDEAELISPSWQVSAKDELRTQRIAKVRGGTTRHFVQKFQ